MKWPFVAIVSAYAVGLLLAGLWPPPPAVLFEITFAVLALALLLGRFRPFLIWPLLALMGWTNLASRTVVVSPNDLRSLIGNEPAIVTVRGVLSRTPQLKIVQYNGRSVEHSRARVRVTEIRRDVGWRPARGEILVSTPAPLPPDFFAGQAVEISGVIARPPPPLANGLFDYRNYLQTRGVFYQLKTDSTHDWKLRRPILSKPPLTDRFLNWSKRTLALGLPHDETLRLLWAMTLGWRTAFTGDVGDPFLRAGTMHLFAIDGLRIALISGMLVTLLRVLQVSRAWSGGITIPLIWFYTAATGWESSAIRASVMMTIVLGGWALKRPSDLVNSLAAAAFLILLWDPRQLFEASFQLSFCVMLVIGLLLPPLNRLSDRLLRHDPLLPNDLIPKWRRALVSVSRMFARYLSLSLAAWVGSIPLSALYFHLFSPISPLANLIAVPLGTLALMSNLGALVCGAWLPWATELFNNAAWFFMSGMTAVSQWFTQIPGAYFYVPAPSWTSIAIYYVALGVALGGWLKTTRRRIFAGVALVLIAAGYLGRWESSRDEIKLTVLPLNGGHSVFVDAAGRKHDWLVDCGSQDAVEYTLEPFLQAQGVNEIPRLVLTTGHASAVGGAPSLDDEFGVDRLLTGPVRFRSSVYRKTVAAFDNRKTLRRGAQAGCWRVLYPAATNHFSRADDDALVLLGKFPGAKVLLLSDLGRAGQSALLAGTNNLRADIVVAGLPENGEPLCGALLDKIQPKAIVIADSKFPVTRRASWELRERLAQQKIPVVFTRHSGAATILMKPDGWELQTMNGREFAGNDARSFGSKQN
jgi:competence protein ComEC